MNPIALITRGKRRVGRVRSRGSTLLFTIVEGMSSTTRTSMFTGSESRLHDRDRFVDIGRPRWTTPSQEEQGGRGGHGFTPWSASNELRRSLGSPGCRWAHEPDFGGKISLGAIYERCRASCSLGALYSYVIVGHSSWETQPTIGAAEGPAEDRVDGCLFLLVPSCKANRPAC